MKIKSIKFIKNDCEVVELSYSEMVELNNLFNKLVLDEKKYSSLPTPPSPPIRPENQIINEFSV